MKYKKLFQLAQEEIAKIIVELGLMQEEVLSYLVDIVNERSIFIQLRGEDLKNTYKKIQESLSDHGLEVVQQVSEDTLEDILEEIDPTTKVAIVNLTKNNTLITIEIDDIITDNYMWPITKEFINGFIKEKLHWYFSSVLLDQQLNICTYKISIHNQSAINYQVLLLEDVILVTDTHANTNTYTFINKEKCSQKSRKVESQIPVQLESFKDILRANNLFNLVKESSLVEVIDQHNYLQVNLTFKTTDFFKTNAEVKAHAKSNFTYTTGTGTKIELYTYRCNTDGNTAEDTVKYSFYLPKNDSISNYIQSLLDISDSTYAEKVVLVLNTQLELERLYFDYDKTKDFHFTLTTLSNGFSIIEEGNKVTILPTSKVRQIAEVQAEEIEVNKEPKSTVKW